MSAVQAITRGAASVLNNQPSFENGVGFGLENVFSYQNIAVSVILLCLIFSMFGNAVLLKALLKTKDVLNNVAVAIAVLNERLEHHVDEGDASAKKD